MTCMTCGNGLGSVMMLHVRGRLGTDIRRVWLTVANHVPCRQLGHGTGNRLIAAQAGGSVAGAIDDLARLR